MSKFKESVEEAEKQIIIQWLVKNAGNKSKAAIDMGIDRVTLYHKIRTLQINMNEVNLQIAAKLLPQ